jgi:hypothetical protein
MDRVTRNHEIPPDYNYNSIVPYIKYLNLWDIAAMGPDEDVDGYTWVVRREPYKYGWKRGGESEVKVARYCKEIDTKSRDIEKKEDELDKTLREIRKLSHKKMELETWEKENPTDKDKAKCQAHLTDCDGQIREKRVQSKAITEDIRKLSIDRKDLWKKRDRVNEPNEVLSWAFYDNVRSPCSFGYKFPSKTTDTCDPLSSSWTKKCNIAFCKHQIR